jgi:hypothetical protein
MYSLASSFKANPCSIVLNETKEATSMDRALSIVVVVRVCIEASAGPQIHDRLPVDGLHFGFVDRIAYVAIFSSRSRPLLIDAPPICSGFVSRQYNIQLHPLSKYLKI